MPASDFDAILAECLERLASGESVAACLARYPQHAPQLGPMLAAAESLRQLGSLRMPVSSRLRAQARMRRALVDANGVRAPGSPWWTRGWFRGLAGLAAMLALVLALSNVLAASRPGDWGYSLRAAAERLPAQWIREPELRVSAELRAANHRLLDLERVVTTGSDAFDPVLAELLASDEAAVQVARTLPEEGRAAVAAQIANHAGVLARLSRVAAEADAQTALAGAAMRLVALAAGLAGDELQPEPVLTPAPLAPMASPGATRTATPEPKRPTPSRTPISSPTLPPAPTATARPAEMTPTVVAPSPTEATTPSDAGELATPEDAGAPQVTSAPPPTDDHTGSGNTPQPAEDHSGSSNTPEPTDDHGGSGGAPQPTDDHGGSGNTPEPGDDHGGRGSGSDETSAPDDGRS